MKFWTLAFKRKWVDAEELKKMVITEDRPNGDITPEQYKEITDIEYVA